MLNELAGFEKKRRIPGTFRAHQQVDVDLGGSKVLSHTVVQLARDTPPLIILHGQQAGGQLAQFVGPLLNQRFQVLMSAPEFGFISVALFKMIPDFVLPETRTDRGPYGADQSCRTHRPFQQSDVS